MMRKGPLDQYPVARVLEDAASERLSGSIEVQARVSGLLFLENGNVYHATVRGHAPPPEAMDTTVPADEVHAHLVRVVALLLGQTDGWYHHHQVHQPMGRYPVWDRRPMRTDRLLAEARALNARHAPLQRWDGELLGVGPATGPASLDADTWTVLATMVRPAMLTEVADRLGWDADRVAPALDRLHGAGLLGSITSPAEPDTDEPTDGWDGTADLRPRQLAPAMAAARLQQRLETASTGSEPTPSSASPPAPRPSPDPPVTPGDDARRSALRRLISSLRS